MQKFKSRNRTIHSWTIQSTKTYTKNDFRFYYGVLDAHHNGSCWVLQFHPTRNYKQHGLEFSPIADIREQLFTLCLAALRKKKKKHVSPGILLHIRADDAYYTQLLQLAPALRLHERTWKSDGGKENKTGEEEEEGKEEEAEEDVCLVCTDNTVLQVVETCYKPFTDAGFHVSKVLRMHQETLTVVWMNTIQV